MEFDMCPAFASGSQAGAGFDSSAYGAFADEAGPAEQDVRRGQILEAALKHVVRLSS